MKQRLAMYHGTGDVGVTHCRKQHFKYFDCHSTAPSTRWIHSSRLFGLAVSHIVTGGELPAQRSRQAGMPGNTRTTVVELNGIAPLRADRKLEAETRMHKAVSTVSQVNLPLCAML
jgi:hypothetical protein